MNIELPWFLWVSDPFPVLLCGTLFFLFKLSTQVPSLVLLFWVFWYRRAFYLCAGLALFLKIFWLSALNLNKKNEIKPSCHGAGTQRKRQDHRVSQDSVPSLNWKRNHSPCFTYICAWHLVSWSRGLPTIGNLLKLKRRTKRNFLRSSA